MSSMRAEALRLYRAIYRVRSVLTLPEQEGAHVFLAECVCYLLVCRLRPRCRRATAGTSCAVVCASTTTSAVVKRILSASSTLWIVCLHGIVGLIRVDCVLWCRFYLRLAETQVRLVVLCGLCDSVLTLSCACCML